MQIFTMIPLFSDLPFFCVSCYHKLTPCVKVVFILVHCDKPNRLVKFIFVSIIVYFFSMN